MSKHHRTCIECNKDFYGYGNRFCCHKCSVVNITREKRTRLKRVEKTCPNCSIKFLVKLKNSRQIFCSTKCSRVNQKMFGMIHSTQLPPKRKYIHTVGQCKRRGIEICDKNSFLDWYINAERVCHYCHIPEYTWQQLVGNKTKLGKKWLTIDRKDNNRGYFVDNMVICCMRCNQVKNSTLEYNEMVEIGEKYIYPKWNHLNTQKVGV